MNSISSNSFYYGLSGVVLPIPKYQFPKEFQQSTRLTYYARFFNSIEINRSFYTLPNPKTVAKWANEVQDDFRFTFKLWKEITHCKGLKFQEEHVRSFIEAIDRVGHKKGSLLIQFPASIKAARLFELQHLLHIIQLNNSDSRWKVAIEFRDKSWFNPDTYEIIEQYSAAIVKHDKSKSASPLVTIDSNSVYVRFHGPQGDYRGSYSDSFLHEYAYYIHGWLEERKDVFVYFNNTMGDAFENLMTLKKYVKENI